MKNLIKRISSVVVAGALVLGSVAILPGTKKKVVYAAEPKYDSANLVNYATIMGRAVDYGIVSQSITQSMHMETTFATYSYSRTVDTTTDVDLTNAKTAQFIVGEVTSRGDLGTLKFGKVRTSADKVFVENMSITLSEGMDPNRYIRYQDDVAQTTKFNYSYRTKKEIQESIDTVIDHARDESGEMVTRTKDADYVLDSTNNSLVSVNGSITTINIDDPKYDNKVVYINLDDAKFKNLLRAWAQEPNGHHLDINKRSSTVIVFTSAKKEAITLGKVSVYAKDSPLYASAASTGVHDYDSYASVTTYSGNQSTHNAYVDKEIAQKLIWNITGSNDITISSNAGTFLCLAGDKTNRNVKVKLTGNPCAGWLVVNGNVENKCEYHYIYGGNSQSQGTEGEGQMHFVARKGFTTKYVDNSVAFKEGDYQFFWQEYTDATFSTPVGQKSTVKVKDTSYMDFPTVTFVKNTPSDPHNVTAAGKNFYFRITEDPSKSLSGIKNSAGHIDICLNAYVSGTGVIKFKMQSVTMIGADDSHLIQYDKNGTWGSSTDWVDVVNTRFDLGAFFNKIQVPGYMTITKTIEGDVTEEDLNGLTFTVTDGGAFTKVYKLGKDFTKNPTTGIYELTTPITVPDAETQYTVTETLYSLDGYKLEEVSYKVDGGATQHNNDTASLDSVSTDSNAPTTVAYTDSYTPLGTLTVKKTAKADNGATINYDYQFSVKNSKGLYLQADKQSFGTKVVYFSVATDVPAVFKDIPVDEYTVTEKTNELNNSIIGYSFDAAGSTTNGKADVTKKANTDFTLDNRFTMDRGSLTVKKTATDNNGNSVEGTFKFTISTPMRGYLQADGSFGNTIHYFTISDGESMTFDNLPVDNYNVTEDLNSVSVTGYTFNSTDSKYLVIGKVTKNGNTNAELVNKYTQDVGELRVTKTAQDNHNTNVSGSFEFSVKNSKGQYLQADKKTFDTTEVFFTVEAGSFTSFEKLPVGKYTVTEKTDSISVTGYTFTSTGSTTSDSATVAKDTTVEVKLINNFIQDLGSLTVAKIAKDNNFADVAGVFEFSVKNSKNQYLQSDEKTFGGTEVFFSVDAGSSKTFTDLPVGEYTITEKTDSINVPGYTYNALASVTSVAGTVSKTTTANSTVTLTNIFTKDVGTLKVKKTAIDDKNRDVISTFLFSVKNSAGLYLQADEKTFAATEVFFSIDTSEAKEFSNLPVGEYTIAENTDKVNIDGYTFLIDDSDITASATIAKDGTANAALNNKFTFDVGQLTVIKEAIDNYNNTVDGTFKFSVMNSKGKYLQSDKETFGDSEYFFTVTTGTPTVFPELPIGKYTITEDTSSADVSGYTFLQSISTTTVETNVVNLINVNATLTNKYEMQLGSLQITKALGSNAPRAAASKTYTFTVTGPNGYSATVQINGARSETLTDLIPGTYTVTEDENGAAISGYDLSVTGGGSIKVLPNDVATITVTNDYTEILGSLTVKKEVNGAPASEADKVFQFAVTGPNRYITFVNLKAGEQQTLPGLPLGKYTVTELGTDARGRAQIKGYTLAVSGEGSVELTTADLDAEVTITNNYTEILGSLTVKKSVTGAPASEADKNFEFTVTGPNGYSETFTLKNGETKTLTDLHLGTYNVTETGTAANGAAQIEGYTLAVSGEGDVELTTSAVDGTATITNAYTEILGSLTVKKEVTGAPASEANKVFEFTVTGPNSYSETFTLKAGEIKTLTDLKLGTYTVTENDTAAQISGYDLVVSGEGAVELTASAKDGSATVTNTYSRVKGSLKVTKTVTGAPASEANKTFEFTVTGPNNYSETFTLKAGESKTLTDLVLGTYTVTENGTAANGAAQISGYDLAVTGEGNVELTAAEKDKTATVTNTYTETKGSLTVKKTVTGAPASAADKEFEFTVTGPNNYSETFKLKAGESKTLTDLVLGTYTVTENGTGANGAAQISGYDLVVTGENSVELTAADKDKTATVTNAYTQQKGALIVRKTAKDDSNKDITGTFEFSVKNSENQYLQADEKTFGTTEVFFTVDAGTIKEFYDIPVGTYTVTEKTDSISVAGYTFTSTGSTTSVTRTVTKGAAYEAELINRFTQDLGSLEITKALGTNAPAAAALKTYTFTVSGPNGYSAIVQIDGAGSETLTDLVPGRYTVTENETDAAISGYDLVVTGGGAVEVDAKTVATTTITNTYTEVKGSLTVTKTVTGAPASEANKTFEFTVTGPNNYSETFTLKNGETKTLSDLKLGTYTVTENGTAANGAAQISGYDLVVTGDGDVELAAANKDKTATVTNAYSDVKGSLTVGKTVTGAPASEANKTFEFTVTGPNNYSATFELKNGESKTLTDLTIGKYTVTENGTAANGAAQISGYDLVVTGEGDVELTVSDKDKTATVTNAYTEILGSLTVKKTVTGAPASEANKTFEFTVTGPNNYSETFTLKNGETKTLSDLKLGTYIVTENGTAANGAAQISGYDLAVTGSGERKVLTVSAKDGSATITNAYTEVKGSLTVTKTVTGAPASEADKEFEFTVTGPNNYSETFKLKNGERKVLSDLALGTYTVTENGTAANGAAQISGYTLAVSGEGDVTLTAANKDGSANVTNAYSEDVKGSLTVTKTVTGAPASAFDKEFEFTVTGPNNYSETFKLKNGERKVLSDLALGTYTVTENGTASDGAAQIKGYTLAVSGDGDVTLTATDNAKTAAVTNTYAETNEKTSVSIQKVWDDNNNQNGDRPASLTVTISNGQSVVLDDSNAWSATVNDLPKYENGSEIVYSWTEEQVQGYRMSSNVKDQNDPSKTIITNTYDASSVQTSATVKKVWDDNNDAAGLRPSSLVVYLLQNGTQIDTCTLNEQNGWTATVNNLAKYDATNAEYVYSWTEETITVAGYALESATVSDTTTTLTNKYTAPAPVLGSLKIKKALAAGAPTDASSMTYHFTVTGTKGYTTTVDIQGEGEFVLDNLELDTYTVTEDTASAAIGGYTLSVTNNGATVVINSANQEECVITNTYKKDVQTTPDPTGTNPTGTEPTGTEPTGTKPSGTKPSVESPYSEVQEPSETTPTPTTAPDKKIDSVTIDDKPVSPEDYTDKPDGTVEFSSNTIEGLTLGVHRALIKYNDGATITIEFEVVSSAGRGRSIVKTGDTAKSNLVPAAAFLSIAVAAVAIVIFRRRRHERDAK